MTYKDSIYGKCELHELVLIELLASPALERLKGINQYGYIGAYFPEATTNRFQHSVGVLCLLRKYGAPLEEQIAGLIHDVSHSAFSHCIDYALKEKNALKQSHQDDILKDYVAKTTIPAILRKYNVRLKYILDDKNFPLKENHLPDICADRIDYLLRDASCFGVISKKDTEYFLKNLNAENGRWFFGNYESAKKFAELFDTMNKRYYAGPPTAILFKTVGDCLKYALKKKYVDMDDLYKTDKDVLDKIKKHTRHDEKLGILWQRMNKRIGSTRSEKNGMLIACKSRAIDPFFRKGGAFLKISDSNKKWKDVVKKESQPKKYYILFRK